jgi:drug/metabolite transporter (DMT)-like permease
VEQWAPVPVVLAVLVAALLHASWNAAAHAMPDREVGFFLLNIGVCVVPIAFLPWVGLPEPSAWPFVVGSVLVHLAYNLLLLRSYQLGDFGQTYPLARGTAPLVVAVVGVAVVGQHLSLVEALGVVTISCGLVVLVLGRGSFHATRPAVVAALTTGIAIATYTVIDGVGVRRAADPVPYIAWIFALQGPLIATVVARRRRGLVQDARALLLPGLLSGLVSFVAYALVVWAQSRGRLATVASLREVSIVFGALIGAAFFRERFGPLRVLGALIVFTGVVVLAFG